MSTRLSVRLSTLLSPCRHAAPTSIPTQRPTHAACVSASCSSGVRYSATCMVKRSEIVDLGGLCLEGHGLPEGSETLGLS